MKGKSSKKSSASVKYLKILGIIQILIGVLGILSAVLMVIMGFNVNELGIDLTQLRNEGVTDDVIRLSFAIVAGIASAYAILVGILLRRAAKDPVKSTFVLVLTVLSLISNVFTLFSQSAFTNVSSGASFAINVTLNVFTLMALLKIRREID